MDKAIKYQYRSHLVFDVWEENRKPCQVKTHIKKQERQFYCPFSLNVKITIASLPFLSILKPSFSVSLPLSFHCISLFRSMSFNWGMRVLSFSNSFSTSLYLSSHLFLCPSSLLLSLPFLFSLSTIIASTRLNFYLLDHISHT